MVVFVVFLGGLKTIMVVAFLAPLMGKIEVSSSSFVSSMKKMSALGLHSQRRRRQLLRVGLAFAVNIVLSRRRRCLEAFGEAGV